MSQNYKSGIKRIAQLGLVSKGIVYMIFGILILLAVHGNGERHIQFFNILKYIITLGSFGRILVLLLALGLLNYSLWKLLQMLLNTEEYPSNWRGYFIRISWIGPFVFYLVLGAHAIIQLYYWYTGTFDYDATSSSINSMVFTSKGRLFIAFIAITLFINSMSLFYLAFTGKFTQMLTGKHFYSRSPHFARLTGFTGYFFYGLALFIISFLFAASLYTLNSSMAKGGLSMFEFLRNQPFGIALLTAIAVGTVCYGIYFFIASFYRWNVEGSHDLSRESSTYMGK